MKSFEDVALMIAAFIASLFGQDGGIRCISAQIWRGIDLLTPAAISIFLILIISLCSTLVFCKGMRCR